MDHLSDRQPGGGRTATLSPQPIYILGRAETYLSKTTELCILRGSGKESSGKIQHPRQQRPSGRMEEVVWLWDQRSCRRVPVCVGMWFSSRSIGSTFYTKGN